MKKLFSVILAVSLLLSLTACKKKSKNPSNTPTEPNATQDSPTYNPPLETNNTLISVSVPTVTENTTHDNGTVLFQYTYQNMSLVLDKPQVADKIILDFLKRVDSTSATAESTREMAKSAYNGSSTWTPYLCHITYNPTRIDHKVLSLFGNNVVYNGGGHPERTCVSASYDVLSGDILTLASIKTKDATTEQFCKLVLEELKKIEKSSYLYEGYQTTVEQRFNNDPSQDEAWYFTQTGLCFYFAPYEIAPYTSGVISAEIPYAKLTAMVHEAYMPLGRTSTEGIIQISPFDQIKIDYFAHIAEIVTDANGKMYMISADDTIQDIRIVYTDKSSEYTIFAAYILIPGNGIMVQGSDEALKNMKIYYRSADKTVCSPII